MAHWGRLVVQRLPPSANCSAVDDHSCASCGYAFGDMTAKVRCGFCKRMFHHGGNEDADECFPSRTVGSSFCASCLPPGPREADRISLLEIASNFEEWGFKIEKIEKIGNPTLSERFKKARHEMSERLGGEAVNEQRQYHLSRAGWGSVCEHGLSVERAKPGRFGMGLYFSPDPSKCDNYWRKSGEAASVTATSTGRDPNTTRAMYACRVLLGSSFKFPPGMTDRSGACSEYEA